MSTRKRTLTEILRQAAEADERSIFALARDANVPYPVLYRFLKGDATGRKQSLHLTTADKLAAALGLELRPKRRR